MFFVAGSGLESMPHALEPVNANNVCGAPTEGARGALLPCFCKPPAHHTSSEVPGNFADPESVLDLQCCAVQAVFLWYPPLHPVNVTARFTPILKQNRYHFASRINSKQIWLQRDSRLEMRGQQLVFVVRACKICSWLLPESAAESVLMCDCARQCQRTNVKKLWIQGVAHLFSERCG